MLQKKITLQNKLGLHARAAAKLVSVTGKFSSHIHLKCRNKEADGKSILHVMQLAGIQGSEIEMTIEGDDETEALIAIEILINDRFGEKE